MDTKEIRDQKETVVDEMGAGGRGELVAGTEQE